MKNLRVSNYQLLFFAFVVVALFALLTGLPGKTSALEMASQTQQILPLGGNNCAPIQISNFTPYIYDNALNSFEFTVSDPSYVAFVGSVGNTSIPLSFFTRMKDASGGVRYHVDINATPLTGTVPVTITLLSARTGQPLCASVIATSLGSGPAAGTYTPPTPTPAPSVKPVSTTPAPAKPAPVSGNVATHTASTAPAVASVWSGPFKTICASPASAYRLWLVLLVLFALVVGGLLWLEFPMSWTWAQAPERVAAAILVLLVLLLGFWYLSADCRAALWMPLVAFLIAVLGLLAAFWNHPKMTQLLLIEQKPPVIITPPPAPKK